MKTKYTLAQCGDMLSFVVGERASAENSRRIAKEIKFNDSPLFGARKKRATLVGELVAIHSALVIFAANQALEEHAAKPVIDSFLKIANARIFKHVEAELPGFAGIYANRMKQYFPALHEERPALGLSYLLMDHLGLSPLKNLQAQLFLASEIGNAVTESVTSMKGWDVIDVPKNISLQEKQAMTCVRNL